MQERRAERERQEREAAARAERERKEREIAAKAEREKNDREAATRARQIGTGQARTQNSNIYTDSIDREAERLKGAFMAAVKTHGIVGEEAERMYQDLVQLQKDEFEEYKRQQATVG